MDFEESTEIEEADSDLTLDPSMRASPLSPDYPAIFVYGRYEILGRLDVGGMAEVFLAREMGRQEAIRHVAIKRLLPQIANDDVFVRMFLDEARLAMRLNHPNICHIYDFGELSSSYFIAMEWVNGLGLGKMIQRCEKGGLPVSIACKVTAHVADALNNAHQARDGVGRPLNIVHRDVTPSNIMVRFDGVVKLLDFGIAKAATQSSVTEAGVVKGKFSYMSPEQCLGRPVDAQSDIFALGACLYEAVTGKPAFRRHSDLDTMRAIVHESPASARLARPDVPPRLDAIIRKALAKDPSQRFQTAGDMYVAIERFLSEEGEFVHAMQIAQYLQRLAPDLAVRGALPAAGAPDMPIGEEAASEATGRREAAPKSRPSSESTKNAHLLDVDLDDMTTERDAKRARRVAPPMVPVVPWPPTQGPDDSTTIPGSAASQSRAGLGLLDDETSTTTNRVGSRPPLLGDLGSPPEGVPRVVPWEQDPADMATPDGRAGLASAKAARENAAAPVEAASGVDGPAEEEDEEPAVDSAPLSHGDGQGEPETLRARPRTHPKAEASDPVDAPVAPEETVRPAVRDRRVTSKVDIRLPPPRRSGVRFSVVLLAGLLAAAAGASAWVYRAEVLHLIPRSWGGSGDDSDQAPPGAPATEVMGESPSGGSGAATGAEAHAGGGTTSPAADPRPPPQGPITVPVAVGSAGGDTGEDGAQAEGAQVGPTPEAEIAAEAEGAQTEASDVAGTAADVESVPRTTDDAAGTDVDPASVVGAVRVTSTPSGSYVRVAGQRTVTPATIGDLPPVEHAVTVWRRGFRTYRRDVEVAPGDTVSVRVRLVQDEPEPETFGRLTLETRPQARVYLGDRLLGSTPLRDIQVPTGSIELRLQDPQGGSHQRTVRVRPGQTSRVFFVLVPE